MAKIKAGPGRGWIVAGAIAAVALSSFVFFSGGCQRKESASEKAGREAREAYEKSKELVKEGYDKTKDLTKEGIAKSQEAAKDFQKGWSEGAKEGAKEAGK
jgi:hypothetical protein